MNLSSSTTKRSWVPEPISPAPSLTVALNTNLLLSTSTSSVSQTTSAPTGEGAECEMSRRVPTVLCPSSRKEATLSDAVASMSATIAGVANTWRVPLPIAAAVLPSSTTMDFLPLIPASIIASAMAWAYMTDAVADEL